MINNEDKELFRKAMKTGRREEKLSVRTAIVAGYLDVCRRPLQGLNQIVFEKCKRNSVEIRDDYIERKFLSAIEVLKKHEIDFDLWHEKLCESIYVYYSRKGYSEFYVGKAQKWINMSLKYIWLFSEENFIQHYIHQFHVPIDRYIAEDIAGEIGFLPGYDGRRFDDLDSDFDSKKANYCWSKINCYEEYLKCQELIRGKLMEIPPIEWEFECWLRKKKMANGYYKV